ncbi:focadhesin [Elysia marginata]|uniref:Focadhesin n=1 Tax=Elysia marginata TaxID=1093978 RepID=A0AAV4GRK6_9GAST|nr:focadhesin [Elysia marginata]
MFASGSVHAQANSVFSLAGLAVCVHNFVAQLEPAVAETVQGSSNYIAHNRWLTVACDTVLSLVSVEHKPMAGLFGLCRQLSTLDRVPASPVCSGAARVALSQLVPVFMDNLFAISSTDLLQKILADLSRDEKAGRSLSGDASPDLSFWNGLALGLLLGRLFEEHFSQRTGSKGMLAVWKALSTLETQCLSAETPSADSNAVSGPCVSKWEGSVLGLASALCGLCKDGGTDARVHALSTLKKIEKCLSETPEEGKIYEMLWYSVARVSVTAQASNANVEDLVLPVLDRLLNIYQRNSQDAWHPCDANVQSMSTSLRFIEVFFGQKRNRMDRHIETSPCRETPNACRSVWESSQNVRSLCALP